MSSSQIRKRKGENNTPKVTGNAGSSNKKNVLEIAPDSAAGQSFWQKLLRRIIVGFTLVGILALLILSDHVYLCIAVIFVQVVSFREIVTLRYNQPEARRRKVPWFRSLNYYFCAISLFYVYGRPMMQQFKDYIPEDYYNIFTHYHLSFSFALYIIGLCGFVLSLKTGHYKYQFTQMAWSISALVIVVSQTSVFIINIFDGLIWFLLPVSLIVWNDIMAYFCGVIFGKKIIKKPFLAISPNKTWEGFIGAAIFTMIFGWFFSGFLAQFQWLVCPKTDFGVPIDNCIIDPVFIPAEYVIPEFLAPFLKTWLGVVSTTVVILPIRLHSLAFSLFASVIAPFGGFFASGMKRAFGIKDFDNIFPGHGGMTDRMDCQMVMGLAVYVHLRTFIKAPIINVTAILATIYALPREQQEDLWHQLNATLSLNLTNK